MVLVFPRAMTLVKGEGLPMSSNAASDSAGFTVHADRGLCGGYTNCVVAAPHVFDLDDGDLVVILDANPPASEADNVRQAVRMCPVSAISLESTEA